jgi:hypothetical protein
MTAHRRRFPIAWLPWSEAEPPRLPRRGGVRRCTDSRPCWQRLNGDWRGSDGAIAVGIPHHALPVIRVSDEEGNGGIMSKREMTSTVVFAAVRARVAVLVLFAPLLCMTACIQEPVDDDEELNVREQEACSPRSGVGCTILRPVGWTVNGVPCIEGPTTPIFRADQQPYTATAVQPTPLFGKGSITLRCDGGCLVTESRSCRKSIIEQ